MGTRAIYEYAATIIAPIYCELSSPATKIDVGPSAAPIIAMDAASLMGKKSDATARVKKIPN